MAYRPEKTNDAYALSRLNTGKQSSGEDEYESVRAIVENCMPVALSPREIEHASTCNDADLSQVKGIWERCTVYLKDIPRTTLNCVFTARFCLEGLEL